MDKDELIRLNVNLNKPTGEALKGICARQGINLTEGIRRAIAVWKFVTEEMEKGRVIRTMDEDGKNQRELLPIF